MTEFQKIQDFIDKSRCEMVNLQTLLTAAKAVAPQSGGPGEKTKCLVLQEWLTSHGLTNQERYDAPDERAEGGIRPNLIVTVPGTDNSRTVWVMSHLDVVPEGDLSLWHSDPWTVVEKDGRIFGRGVEDNQQGLVCSVFAALAFVKLGITPLYTVKLLFAADEENGSDFGVQYLLNNYDLFRQNDSIIIPDGGDSLGETIEIAEKNLLWLRVETIGKQAHGSRPDQGANASLAACDLAVRLHEMKKVFNKSDALFEPSCSTFEPTKKEANVPNINTIPGADVFYMDCRILPCYPLSVVREEINRRCHAVEVEYGVKVSLAEPQSAESPATPVDAPVVKELSNAIELVYGRKARPVGIGGGTVGACLRSKGFHAAVWSCLDDKAHQPDEYCIIENLVGDAKVLAAVFLGSRK